MAGLECAVCGIPKLVTGDFPSIHEAPMRNEEDLRACCECGGVKSNDKCWALEEALGMQKRKGEEGDENRTVPTVTLGRYYTVLAKRGQGKEGERESKEGNAKEKKSAAGEEDAEGKKHE